MENNLELKSFLERAENIAIFVSPDQTNVDAFSGAVSLFYILKKIGKIVNLFPKIIPIRLASLSQPLLNIKNYILTINTKGKRVSNLYYEKTDDTIKISIAFNSGEFKEEDFTAASKRSELNAIVSLNFQSLKDVEKFASIQGVSINNSPIFNIDNSKLNELFGKINLIEVNQSISTIVCSFIRSFDQDLFDKNIATLLALGLISFARKNSFSQKALKEINFLEKIGVNWKKIISYFFGDNNLPKVKLLEKSLEGLSVEKVPYIFLKKNDFEETGASQKDLAFVIENLKSELTKLPSCLLLWESHLSDPKIGGVFYSSQNNVNQSIKTLFNGQSKGNGVLFKTSRLKPEAIKKEIFQLIQ